MSYLEIENLRKEFDVPGGVEVAVEDVSLSIEQGEFVTLVGPSGCGKTTTLRCIAGLETPTSGKITAQGEDYTMKSPQERNLSMVFQRTALYPHMTVRQNIEYPLKLQGISKEERNERSREAAEIVQIDELLDKHPGDLSGGQQQRVSIARAIVRDPIAFLMDEPMSDLDAKLKRQMRKELERIHKELESTIIYVTHDQHEAMTMSDKVAVMNDGLIEQADRPEEVYRNPNNIFVARFIGSPEINTLSGTVESLDEMAIINIDDGPQIEFAVDDLDPDQQSDDVIVGFRPQHVKVTDSSEDGIPASVNILEPLGDDVQIYFDGPQGELRGVIPSSEAPDENATVSIQIPESSIYLFNEETGVRFARGNQESTGASRIEQLGVSD